MTIADDDQNPRLSKNLAKSLDAIAALRAAMEQRLAETQKAAVAPAESTTPEAPQEAPKFVAAPAPETAPEPVVQAAPIKEPAPKAEAPKVEASKAETRREEPKVAQEKPQAKPQAEAHPQTQAMPQMDPSEWSRVMFRMADRVQRLMQDFLTRNQDAMKDPSSLMPTVDVAHIGNAFLELAQRILKNPEHFADAQIALWSDYLHLWQNMLARAQGKELDSVIRPAKGDKRFVNREWQDVWMFDLIKQSYLLTAQWAHKLVHSEAAQLDPQTAHKVEFYTKQMIDAVSPSNFWLTNPEVLRATIESGGENLIKGLENLLTDLERGHGMLNIRMSNEEAFKVGTNLATTPGKVVYQNALMQLIQYAPTTEAVAKTPLLIIPPWINKFYILDLREKNSYIRYLVDQGHTVFCISWVNPDAKLALTNFDDYMSDGLITAMRQIKALTGEDTINTVGYCIGGTLLASALAYLEAVNPKPTDLPAVSSATYLVTMVDFAEPGDLGVFIDDDQIRAIEIRMAQRGYLDASAMATTFNLLRSNDLIWSFVVNNYLLGREPFPFDILYWNADSTNLPAVMHSFYLRRMYMANKLIEPNGLSMKSVPIDLTRITTPGFMLATQDDHIAPWKSAYAATQIYQGPVKFVLAGSGHIAGVVNPPAANKYGYWANDSVPNDINPAKGMGADAWMANAHQHNGSWWPMWVEWLCDYSGGETPARAVTHGIEDAPGSYVKVRAA